MATSVPPTPPRSEHTVGPQRSEVGPAAAARVLFSDCGGGVMVDGAVVDSWYAVDAAPGGDSRASGQMSRRKNRNMRAKKQNGESEEDGADGRPSWFCFVVWPGKERVLGVA